MCNLREPSANEMRELYTKRFACPCGRTDPNECPYGCETEKEAAQRPKEIDPGDDHYGRDPYEYDED